MAIVSVNNDGIMFVDYDLITPLPDEVHILASSSGNLWTMTASGLTGLITLVDGATGQPEALTYISPDGNSWQVILFDDGIMSLSNSVQKRIFSPVGNTQFKLADGSLAIGYSIATFYTGTTTPASTWGSREGFVVNSNPVPFNSLAFPVSPIFIEVGTTYDFVLLNIAQVEVYRWNGVSAGIDINTDALSQWIPGTPALFVNASTISVAGDQRATYNIGRRVRITTPTGILHGTIISAEFDSSVTTIRMFMDAGDALTGPIVQLDYSVISSLQGSIPDRYFKGLTTVFNEDVNAKLDQPFNLLPPGVIMSFGDSIPPRWLLCDGTIYNIVDHPDLFKAITNTFGGNGTTTFGVPDLRGRLALGKDNMGGTASGRVTSASLGGSQATIIGGVGGLQTNVLTIANLAAHKHEIQTATGSSGGGILKAGSASPSTELSELTGGNAPHNNMPPWIALNRVIWSGAGFVLQPTAFSSAFSNAYY